jgi:3-methyladenine DNA glycosylase/8-oxoguanine DNA glycosylase
MKLLLTIPAGKDFSFWRTVFSHGWCALPPFYVNRHDGLLTRVYTLHDGRNCSLQLKECPAGIRVSVPADVKMDRKSRADLARNIGACFRVDEDFTGFYREARRHPDFRWVATSHAGRLLRAPTVFEDVVKMICTTNCSWSLTEVMVGNLCKIFGEPVGEDLYSFPSPAAIADSTDRFLRSGIRSGYRSSYLLELSRRVAGGGLDIESWRSSDMPTEELFLEVRSIKGVGPYAAGNILKLLGRYDYLGIDSWSRAKFFEIHRNGRKSADRAIDRHYERFGKWRGLFFWMDVTKEWYQQKFPF